MSKGEVLNGRYKIENERIDAGSFSSILLAVDIHENNKEYDHLKECCIWIFILFFRKAIKEIYIKPWDNKYFINNIIPEIKILSSYKHENILKYYDNFSTNNFLYIVTEYCKVLIILSIKMKI